MPDVLFYELMTTSESSRKRCFKKLPNINNPVELIPNVGSLRQFELNTHQPCTPLYYRRLRIRFIFNKKLMTDAFQFTHVQLKSIQQRQQLVSQNTKSFFQLAMMVPCFFPHLNGVPWSDFPRVIQEAKREVATNVETVREIYARLLEYDAPPNAVKADVIDPNWAHFRWVQIRVIYSLNLLLKYQGQLPINVSKSFWRKIEHEMLDTEYVILGALAGALASKDERILENYLLVRPDGLVFKS